MSAKRTPEREFAERVAEKWSTSGLGSPWGKDNLAALIASELRAEEWQPALRWRRAIKMPSAIRTSVNIAR